TGKGGVSSQPGNPGGSGGKGGGIYNSATLTVNLSTLDSNSTGAGGDAYGNPGNVGSRGSGGGIYNQGSVTVTDSTFKSNAGGVGGGIENFGALANVSGSTFDSNSGKVGGGASNYFAGGFTLTNDTFYNNTASQEGGGIWSDGLITVNFCTIANNSAPAGEGGGVYMEAGMFTIKNSILAGNTSGNNCGV